MKKELIERIVEEAIQEKIELAIEEMIDESKIKKIVESRMTEANLKGPVLLAFESYIENNSSLDDILAELIQKPKYKEILDSILFKLLSKSESVKMINEYIEETYLEELENVCLFDDMLHECMENFEFRIVPKEKAKK